MLHDEKRSKYGAPFGAHQKLHTCSIEPVLTRVAALHFRFVLLVESLDMAVLYPSDELDPSSAAVADRLRKQAKTRAVRLVREAIACPNGGVTEDSGRPTPHISLPSIRISPRVYLPCE